MVGITGVDCLSRKVILLWDMGTNFYTKLNECDKCKRFDSVHLGKSSGGWQFSFQYNGGKFYKNVKEMKKWLSSKTIENEYGEIINNKDFWEMVSHKQKYDKLNHAVEMKKEYPNRTDDFLVGNYSFSDCYFS